MKHGRLNLTLFFAGSLAASFAVASEEARQMLRISWPEHWEYRSPQRQGPAIHLQAREQKDGSTLQMLDVTVIDTRSVEKPITTESIRELVSKLRDASLAGSIEKSIPLQELSNHRGYCFVASDAHFIAAKMNSYRQMVEGVLFHQSYLITFTLRSNDVHGAGAQRIIDALNVMSIDQVQAKHSLNAPSNTEN